MLNANLAHAFSVVTSQLISQEYYPKFDQRMQQFIEECFCKVFHVCQIEVLYTWLPTYHQLLATT